MSAEPARDLSVHIQGDRFVKKRDFRLEPKYKWRPLNRLRTSKARREKRCYDILREIGIATPSNIRIREERNAFGLLQMSEISMDYLPDTIDLRYVALLPEYAYLRTNAAWRRATVDAVAGLVKRLHDHDFFPQNLHFRNLLVDKDAAKLPPTVYLIDCVSGRRRRWFRRRYYERKDLAFLYNDAGAWCTLRERVRFLHVLFGTRNLSPAQRRFSAEVVAYAEKKWGGRRSSLAD